MKKCFYARERNVQILIYLLKAHHVRKVIASPGTRNFSLVASLQQDSYFEMYSCVDERSAAYMACGLAEESGEPVMITCTGATASRNYMPGLTEAYYRKLPVLAVTGDTQYSRVGHLHPQVIDRSAPLRDIYKLSERVESVREKDDEWDCEVRINRALLELRHHGGGPVHIDLVTGNCQDFSVKQLPTARVINRITFEEEFPDLNAQKIAIFVGSHTKMSKQEIEAIDRFCTTHNAVVLHDHTSGYYGLYGVRLALLNWQLGKISDIRNMDLLIHIGEVSGDYPGSRLSPKEVWRVSEDGELRDTFRALTKVFEMREHTFFEHYGMDGKESTRPSFFEECKHEEETIQRHIPEFPFSNPWIASQFAPDIPHGSVLHFGILNSLRAWNFFPLSSGIESHCNVGGFGIDGPISTLVGASLSHPEKIHFLVVGDLAFFYDLNAMGNRHLGPNVRILLVNNGRGAEFRIFCHPAFVFGKEADKYIAASGHNGNQSISVVKDFATSLGFEYLAAQNKEELLTAKARFLTPEVTGKPMLLEAFTNDAEENRALEILADIEKSPLGIVNKMANKVLSGKSKEVLNGVYHAIKK